MPGFIASQIARINRNYALVALALALVAGGIGWFGWMYISAVVLGPRLVTAEEIMSPRFQADTESYKSVIAVRGSATGPVFYRERVRRGKSYATLYCWLLTVGEKQILVEDWSASPQVTATGIFGQPNAHLLRLAHSYSKTQEILPLLIDQREWKQQGWILLVLGSLAAIAAAVIAGMLMRWRTHPEAHPVRRAVTRLGDFESTAMQIDGEMQAEFQRFGAVHLGQTTLVYAPTFKFDVVRLESITAAWTQWLQQGKIRALFLLLEMRDARRVKWQIAKRDADELVASVRTAAHLEETAHPL